MTQVSLDPEEGIAVVDGRMCVVSLPAWLKLSPLEALSKRRWVRIRYSSGLFDPLTRPILRLRTANDRVHYNVMNGAVLGSAEWIGRIPKNTVEASISPTRFLGPFSFRIDRIQSVNRLELLARGMVTHPGRTYTSVTRRLTNARQSSWDLLKFVNAATPFSRYQEWHRRFVRPFDLSGFDRPRLDWRDGPEFVLFARPSTSRPDDIRRTLASLQAQIYPRWRLFALTDEAAAPVLRSEFLKATDKRLQIIDHKAAWPPLDDHAFVASISFGDRLRDYALSCLADAAIDHPEWQVLYADEDSFSGSRLHSPILKPDWSPVLNESSDYLGRLTCVRASLVAEDAASLKVTHDTFASKLVAGLATGAVGHVRRILYQRNRTRSQARASKTKPGMRRIASTLEWPGVGIVLPTRDRPDLLAACLEGLKEMTDYPNFEVVIVDNGTADTRALALIAALRSDPRFKSIRDDGAFNYSRLCNAGANATNRPYLVFLNNDLVMYDRQWLKALLAVAIQPQAGMVGAKLLFPNGRLQHAGIVLGTGGIAGHNYLNLPADAAGYLSELQGVREVSAVTGACCAVERAKFDAVGGYDEINLPVELNDIDLCLRLAEKGWQNYWTPESVLIHLQSASRGAAERPSDLYAKEHAYFGARWADVIRDDPCFHPALSLFSQRPALG